MSEERPLKALDLCCGKGGWSDGLVDQGFDVVGVDIVDVGYPYRLILADIRDLPGEQFQGFDVIVGSPPCREFTTLAKSFGSTWPIPPDPARGLELINAFRRIVEEAQPKIWLMENVRGLQNYLDLDPRMEGRLSRGMYRSFWGDFPLFLIPRDMTKPLIRSSDGHKGEWERAKIPFPTARSFAWSCREYLENNQQEVKTIE